MILITIFVVLPQQGYTSLIIDSSTRDQQQAQLLVRVVLFIISFTGGSILAIKLAKNKLHTQTRSVVTLLLTALVLPFVLYFGASLLFMLLTVTISLFFPNAIYASCSHGGDVICLQLTPLGWIGEIALLVILFIATIVIGTNIARRYA